ncbi:MAG: zinc-dependent metalloprotease, partial [Chroococcidiopsis sp.]
MKSLSARVFLLHSALFTIFFVGARLPASAIPSEGVENWGVVKTFPKVPVSLPESKVWVIKNSSQQPELQSYVWLANHKRQDNRQSTLLLAQESNQQVTAKNPKPSELKAFNEVIKNSSAIKGLFTLYRQKDTGKVYLEIQPQQFNKNFLSTMTMEAGIGERGIYSGMPLQDFLFYFQRVNNNIHFVVRNVNFRVTPGSPQTRSLMRSFSDSVLYSIPIKSIHPQRKTILIDLGDLLLKDLPGLAASLSTQLGTTYQLDENKSYFGSTKAFPLNMEIESVYGFSYGGAKSSATPNLMTLPDSRALTLRIRYSLSELSANSTYKPRLADDRIGYFITAYQDFAIEDRKEPFVRYINRWHLEKQNPNAKLSPPKEPIVFWIENAVPLEYRDAVKEGVLMWNKAFEKAGFINAIEVRQMPDDAKWDPADVRYNVIRWINTVDGFFALGPSRVNPLTGEILDADILVDASFVRLLKQEYRRMVQDSRAQPTSVLSQMINDRSVCNSGFGRGFGGQKRTEGENINSDPSLLTPHSSPLSKLATEYDLCYGMEAANQFDFGSLALTLFQNTTPNSDKMQQYIHQYLRLIIAHEVGHTLGLRHNFRGSTQLPPNELNATKITRDRGLTTSVMDYLPPNLAPPEREQGDFFPDSVGSYDEWAIEYGYMPTTAVHPLAERRFLDQIGDRSSRPDLAYATDEDRFDLDPDVNAWDYSSDVLGYSQGQLDIARAMWKKLNRRYPTSGESYSDLSELFDRIFLHYLRHTYYATKYIGGQS